MESKVFAVDFDGTISLGKWPEVGPANDRLISYLLDVTTMFAHRRILINHGSNHDLVFGFVIWLQY